MFPQLSQTLNIILTILVAVVALWVLFLFAAILFAAFFRTALKKHSKAMTVILNAKYENVKKVYMLFQQYEIHTDSKLLETLESIDPKCFEKQNTEEGTKARDLLSYLRDEATFIVNKNKQLLEYPDFVLARNNVLELDNQYRNSIALYNADVLGYNYWITFGPVRFIFKIFKAQKKEIIA